MSTEVRLDRAPLGAPLVLRSLDVQPAIGRRLAQLGLRRGTPVTVLRRIGGGGRVLAVAGARVAVAKGVLAGVKAEVES